MESTEDLLSKFEEFNSLENVDRDELVALSMDANTLYPSLQIGRSSEVVYDELMKSEVLYRNVDVDELTRYLAVVLDNHTLQQYVVDDFVMVRRHKNGPKPGINGLDMKKHWKDDETCPWVRNIGQPSESDVRKMFALALSQEVKTVMQKHTFRFKDKMYVQDEGG